MTSRRLAVLASALGSGANTSIFTVANSVLLRPLPFPEPDQLLWITEVDRNTGEDLNLLGPDYLEWRERKRMRLKTGLNMPRAMQGPL